MYLRLKKLFKDNKPYKKIIIYTISIIITSIIANIANTLALVLLAYTYPINNIMLFMTYAIPRLLSVPIHVIIYIPICYIVCEKFKKIKFIN